MEVIYAAAPKIFFNDIKNNQTSHEILKGKPLFLLGRNGTGKSALIAELVKNFTAQQFNVSYMPGSRPVSFGGLDIIKTNAQFDSASRYIRDWNLNTTNRYECVGGPDRNAKAIQQLLIDHQNYREHAINDIIKNGRDSKQIDVLQSHTSPLDKLNAVLKQSNLNIQITIIGNQINITQNELTYNLALASDGERSALITAAEILTSPTETIFALDEPEAHLHPSIATPLIKALINARNDCYFIIVTHSLEMPTELRDSQILLVRSCKWSGFIPVGWETDKVDSASKIPETLRVDLLGSRKKILFVEGDSRSSLDNPLYSLLFPKATIRPKGSCKEIEQAIKGLSSLKDLHLVEAYGLVDRDDMSDPQVSELEAQGIYVLPVNSVESIYYSEPVIRFLAFQQATALKLDAETLYTEAIQNALTALNDANLRSLAKKNAKRKSRHALLSKIKEIKESDTDNEITLSIPNTYKSELAKIQLLYTQKNIQLIISKYPARESPLFGTIAKSLRFQTQSDYESAALVAIQYNDQLRDTLLKTFGELSKLIGST